MDEQDRDLLDELLELSKDNNQMIKKLYRSLWWSKFWKWVYWLIILGLILGGYVAIQPYIGQIQQIYQNLLKDVGAVKGVSNAVGNLIKY